MTEKDKKIRDELALDFAKKSWYGRSDIDYLNVGFDAGFEHAMKQNEKLVELITDFLNVNDGDEQNEQK